MKYQFQYLIKVFLFLCLFGLESSELEKSKKEKMKVRSEIVKVALNSKADNLYKPLTLEDLISNINENFSLLLAAFQDIAIADGELLSARGAFDGSIKANGTTAPTGFYSHNRMDMLIDQPTTYNGMSFFGGYRLGRGSFAPYDGKLATNSLGEIRAGAKIPLWRDRPIDKNRAAIKQAEIGVKIADLSVAQQKIDIIRNATLRYWDWIAAARKYIIAKNLYDIALEREKQILKRVKAGDIPPIEQVDNERVLLQRESFLLGSAQALEIASNELSIYLTDANGKARSPRIEEIPENIFSLFEDIKDNNLEKEIEQALIRRPELERFKAQRDQNQVDQELARNQMSPGVDIVIAASQDLGTGSVTRSRPEVEAAIVLNVPLRTRTQQGKLDSASAKNEKLSKQEQFFRDRISADIRNTFTTVNVTRQRAVLAQKEFLLAKKLEEAERTRYVMGEGTLLVVNIREQTTGEAAIREVDALADHHRAVANFKAAIADVLKKKD
ncbi:MAG TPA: TolC family protein [Leptospiraceae bacterium]|nr:TolC family protein [Leptospiraceae bacterium]HMW04988.1 TolC family protein [Leptospiraceae bacterium]HMX33879.1 TolC family protein [Leptospiraceae bacterium]HMY30791.1 TolC family protein [Leptospiraceae bacterium]HMZ66372.1 TolC family protein [Leptospiraceae bacterium]